MTTVNDVLAAAAVLERALSITEPDSVQTKRAFAGVPSQAQALTEFPVWTNSLFRNDVDRFPNSMRYQHMTIHVQCYVGKAGVQDDQLMLRANAFYDALVAATDVDPQVGGTAQNCNVVPGQPVVGRLERGGEAYIGVDAYLELFIKDTQGVAV